MVFQRNIRSLSQTLTLLFALLAMSCSDNGTGPDKDLAPLVGTWRANTLVHTNQANPSISVDLLDLGATFTLSILSTGQYSASISGPGILGTELGTITVSGNEVTITPTSPEGPPQLSIWSFQGSALVLDGESAFDFNQDGETEPSFAHIVMDPLSF